jgi:nucleoside-diphosphate-sugar epimerase
MASTKLVLGCGYLGQRVAALWRNQGDRVHATTRRPEGAETLRRLGLEPVVCDVLERRSLQVLPQVDTVVYAVALDRSSGATMRSVYVDGLANVLEHLQRLTRFVYVSSSSVYGQTDGGWVDETAPTEPEEDAGRIVLEAERLLRARLPETIILRFAGIYGPGRLLRRKALEAGEPIIADADKWLNLIHVEDGARAVLAAEQRGRLGAVYNISDGHPVRRRDFYAEEARVLGAAPPRFVAPPPDRPPPHEKANRRIANQRMQSELAPALQFPDYRQGLTASV